MPVVSLIAPRGALDVSLVQSLMGAWGAVGDAVWLSPDEAVEFPIAAPPENLADVRRDLHELNTDANVLPDGPRRKRLLLADMDSTMIEQECLDELADVAGIGPRVAEITRRAMNGEIGFEGALKERVGLLAGKPEGLIQEVLGSRISNAPGGRTLVATMHAHGAHTALVSGGFTQFTAHVADALGFDEHRANHLVIEDGLLTGEVVEPILGKEAKAATLAELVKRLELAANETLAVGDGANDLGMLHAAGLGVALHAKPVVAAEAPVRIDHGDLTALLFLQGYTRLEFRSPDN